MFKACGQFSLVIKVKVPIGALDPWAPPETETFVLIHPTVVIMSIVSSVDMRKSGR